MTSLPFANSARRKAGLGLLCAAVVALSSTALSAQTDRKALIDAFPAETRALITDDIPVEVIESLLSVRKSGPKTFVFRDSGGELWAGQKAAYLDNWAKLTGWQVRSSNQAGDVGSLQALTRAGQLEYSAFQVGATGAGIALTEKHLLGTFDKKLFAPIFDKFPAEGRFLHGDGWVQNGYTSLVVTWDTKKWPRSGPHPETFRDLFDEAKFPGKRCLRRHSQYGGNLEYALLADGVPAEKLYPLDVERALRKLDTIKRSVVWWGSGAEGVQNIVNGNCALGIAFHGRVAFRVKEDPTLNIGVNWRDTLLIDDAWGIPKAAPQPEAANSILAYALTPRNQCRFLNTLGYGITIDPSCLDDFGRNWSVTTDRVKESAARQDNIFYAKHGAAIQERFLEWLTE